MFIGVARVLWLPVLFSKVTITMALDCSVNDVLFVVGEPDHVQSIPGHQVPGIHY